MKPYVIIRRVETAGTVRARAALVAAAALLLGGCSLGQSLGAESGSSTPSTGARPQASGSPVALPNYNSRFGSNRTAAQAAVRVGRSLYAQQMYWEVYVKTDPAALAHDYDPTAPDTFTSGAQEVRSLQVILATESGTSIQLYAKAGVEQEKKVLAAVGAQLQEIFPNARTMTLQVYFGESNLHANATYAGGQLDYKSPSQR
ncbi:MAG: hypothetical protein QOE92_2600 [Chloroflexota bacterium]|nr:hypothetical protein [Chloroflexota bacterium]